MLLAKHRNSINYLLVFQIYPIQRLGHFLILNVSDCDRKFRIMLDLLGHKERLLIWIMRRRGGPVRYRQR